MSRPHPLRKSLISSRSARNRKPRFALQLESLEARYLLTGTSGEMFAILDSIPASATESQSYIQPQSYTPFTVSQDQLQDLLNRAPFEFTSAAANPIRIQIPTPTGQFQEFAIVESAIMAPELAAKFPDITTYRGIGVEDPSSSVRLDLTPLGFHASVLDANGAYYIDPYYHLDTSVYVSYFTSTASVDAATQALRAQAKEQLFDRSGNEIDLQSDAAVQHSPQHEAELSALNEDSGSSQFGQLVQGETLRTFRLANAATVEYVNFFGGTTAAGQAAIVTAINRVNQVYENDFAVRMVLVANNDSIVYTGSTGSDPYTNNNGGTMLGQNQANLDAVIGAANYDIGHVFSTGGGGVANLGVVGINGLKARGVTGLSNPVNDPFYIDYVAHEMGHQYDALHTFNGTGGSCNGNRSSSAAYEPGSGSTIMAYAGICGSDNLQAHSDPYFHFKSLQEISAYVNSISGVGTSTSTGNTGPTADAGQDYTIPTGTPFRLTGSGTDVDGDTLTYTWEQADLGPARTLSAGDNGSSPIIRSRMGTTNPTRIIPRLNNLLSNTFAPGEILPSLPRALDFNLIVRDNAPGGAGYAIDAMRINVVNTGASFSVTNPNSNSISWNGNSQETITWNVAGTNTGTVNTPNVNILLSTDGGQTYPFTLASNVPNDGSESIVVPNVATNQARVMVEGAGNIFFDISNFNLSISQSTTTGDFNGDGLLDCADIDELTMAVSVGSTSLVYDLNGDSLVNLDDVNEWVVNLKGTLMGDANLDFSVDGSDFIIWNANKFSTGKAWCTGDFDADGITDGNDFLIWNVNKFQSATTLWVGVQVAESASAMRTKVRPPLNPDGKEGTLSEQPLKQNAVTVPFMAVTRVHSTDPAIRRVSATTTDHTNEDQSARDSLISKIFASYPA